MKKIISISLVLCLTSFAQEIIDISVKGISDNKIEGAQKDRKEAIMDAKRQACEKAGLQIKSKTTVENFQTVFDHVESESEAVLLPGFQIIDIGYVADGTYQVVLTGKIKMVEEEKISAKELRYAKSLYDREKYSECKQILEKYIDNKENNASEALQEESLYLYIKWGFSFNTQEDCEKYAAYYPDSPKVERILKFGGFSAKPIIKYNNDVEGSKFDWEKGEYSIDNNTFMKKKNIIEDTLIVEDFSRKIITLVIDFAVFKYNLNNPDVDNAYKLNLKYWFGNTNNPTIEDINIIDDREKLFSKRASNSFQHSTSGKYFYKFILKNYQIKAELPDFDKDKIYNLRFDIYQIGF